MEKPAEAASPDSVTPTISSDNPIAQFSAWSERYLDASREGKAAMEAEGIALAQARRAPFKQLIRDDPQKALHEAVPMVVRQQLPAAVTSFLERRISTRAAVTVYQGVPPLGEPLPLPGKTLTHRVAQIEHDGAYNLHVYGRRAELLTNVPNAAINGVGIDREIATYEEPLRVLEVGELPDASKPKVTVCPISGQTTANDDQTAQRVTAAQAETVVETPEEIVYLCGGYHRPVYAQQLVYGEGSTSGPTTITGPLPAAPTPALGVLKVLYIPLTFQDQNIAPATESKCYEVMRDVADYYLKSSFGKLTTLTTVTPPIKLPKNEAWYVQRDTSNGGDIDGLGFEMAHARDEARRLGFDHNDYDVTVVRLSGGARPTGGWGGTGNVWVYSDSVGVTAHEIGHSFGLSHANFWDTSGTSSIGPGANAEYGDSYDVMGGGGVPTDHYNAAAKVQVKWLPDNFVQNVTTSGLYRIYAFDQAVLDPRNRYAMTVVKDSQRTYWGEVRQNYNGSANRPWADKGLILGWKFPLGNGGNIQLIDTTPGSPYGKDDAAIALGQTFGDTEAGIFMTTVGVSSTTPKYVDVVVNMGDFSANQTPALSLAASADYVPVNATVTFTATATDPDSDTLAYQWQHWGDTGAKIVSPNSPVITRTFATAGSYVVSCTVSDMKGGTITRSRLIIVGTGNSRFTISGRVTADGIGLPGVLLNANGTNPVITDQDGYYTIANLAANTYSVTPLLYGYSFVELFNNSVAVGPNFTGADFEATVLPSVALTAPDGSATENGGAGGAATFRFTRTGDTTLPLTVSVATVAGTAATGDYTLNPVLTSGSPFGSFTIPADSATLDVILTTVNDAVAEGPETVIYSVVAGAGYLVAPNAGTATVTILDDDTALPQVAVRAATDTTVEGSATPGAFVFTRTGSTASALPVTVAISGTAASGNDFTAIASPVAIPAGAASLTVDVTALDDTLVESLETVKVTLSTGAGYVILPSLSNATVSLIDDDTPTVSVTAGDATATEIDLVQAGAVADTGTFLISRTGDTTDPLTIYYSIAGTTSAGTVPALNGVDFEALAGVAQIPAGAASTSVTILPRWDGFGETAEQVVLQLGAGPTNYLVGSASSATVTIADAPGSLPYVEVIPVTASAAEPSTQGKFRVSLKGTAAGTVAINFAIAGSATVTSDYTVSLPGSPSGSSFDAVTRTGVLMLTGTGTNVGEISIVPVNDAALEDIETVAITLTPGGTPAFKTFGPTTSATLWLKDDDQPTVWADSQVGTTAATIETFTEGASTTPVKFYVSRTGSTANALAVNFTLGGSATPVDDYTVTAGAAVAFDNVSRSGTLTIAAGSSGGEVPIAVVNDTDIEGTENILFQLAAGSYSRTPESTLWIADNETNTQKVFFDGIGATGTESTAAVTVPVSLTAPATAPTTVEYVVDTGSRAATTATLSNHWVRVVRNGNSFSSWYSIDGVFWRQRGTTQTISMSSSSYLVGIEAASASSGTSCVATIDNVAITGLEGAGTVGGVTHTTIGTSNPASSSSETGGVYTLTAGGTNLATSGTGGDVCRYVYFPITNSTTATVTARVSVSGGVTASQAGVMIRETTNSTSKHMASMAQKGGLSQMIHRITTSAVSLTVTGERPYWVQLRRVGNSMSGWVSPNGSDWGQISSQTVPFAQELQVGLAVSARSDGSLATAVFDNVALDVGPLNLVGRTIGYVNAQGSDTLSSGSFTVSGSGAQIGGNEDECHFVSMPVSGDFIMTARVVSQTGGASNAQAGLMARDVNSYRSRAVYCGMAANAMGEFIYRNGTLTTAYGAGVDHTAASGLLTFAIGEQTKDISFTVNDDTIPEPHETVTLLLRNSNGAQLNAPTTFTYTIQDNDTPPPVPSVQFGAGTGSVAENATSGGIHVSLSSASTNAVTVDYSVTGGTATGGGTDYTLVAGTLTFAPGELVKTIPMTLADEVLIEGSETVIVTLTNPVNANLGSVTNHTLTITDDDFPVVTLVATDPNAAEAGLNEGEFTFYRTGPTDGSLTVNYGVSGTASSGSDRQGVGTSVTFQPGFNYSRRLVTPINDADNEGPETVILTISANASYTVGSPASATVTIADDDRSTVTITANDPNASESAGNTGQFTLTRTAPTTGSLTVAYSLVGTAVSGTDYAVTGSAVFAANETNKLITITPANDSDTEGDETAVLSLSTGSYVIGGNGFDTVVIHDNDSPPVVYVTSPASNGPLIANGNGVVVSASVTDDGAPQPVTLLWTQASGPGTATFETPANISSAVTFTADGVYVLRVTATDGQFTVSDQVTVVVGGAIAAAEWIAQDMGPSTQQRGQSARFGSGYVLTGMGAGYGTASDAGHVMTRQVTGDGSVVARLSTLTGAASAPLAGITIRDSLARACNRAVLGYNSGALQFRTRTTISTTDAVTTQGGITLPVWLKLERTGNNITASYASDVGGSPGNWTPIGTTIAITMANAMTQMGLTATSNDAAAGKLCTATFDGIALTPAPAGPALITEDFGVGTPTASTFAFNGTTYTIGGSGSMDGSGAFYGWQYYGDLVVTAKHADATSGALNAKSGIMIRESMDNAAAYIQLGRIPTGSFSGYIWRTLAGGSGGGVPSFTAKIRWVRLVRAGNRITAFHAPDSGGNPGTWTQLGQPQTIVMGAPVLVGFAVDNAGGTAGVLNVAQFSNLTIAPLNKAPIVNTGTVAADAITPVSLNAMVTDDNYPAPPNVVTLWTAVAGPGGVTFGNPNALATTASFAADGSYALRLRASDGSVESFDDLTFAGYTSSFAAWQGAQFPGGSSNPLSAWNVDADFDGRINGFEYCSGTLGAVAEPSPVLHGVSTVGADRYLSMTVPKNPNAPDVVHQAEATSNPADPLSWSSNGLIIEVNNATTLRVRDVVPIAPGQRRFMRVRMTTPQ